jgi:hypothetical protein
MTKVKGMGNAILNLHNFIFRTRINANDNEVTLGETQEFIRGAFDSNGDGLINNGDRFDTNHNGVIDAGDNPGKIQMLREMAYADLSVVADPVLRKELQQAQAALRLALSQSSPILPPPPIDSANPLFNDELIRNPYDLADDSEDGRWSDMRRGFQGRTITINRGRAKELVTDTVNKVRLSNPSAEVDEQARAVVENLWANEDYVGGERRQVFRVGEIKGVLDYINSLPPGEREQFKQAFFKNMADYISNPGNGLDEQFVMDSLLQVLQSSDFSGDAQSQELGHFIKELTVGIAQNSSSFRNRVSTNGSDRVVIGNYDGTNDGGIYGSLALVRNADGTFTFIEHQVSSPTNKTRYIFEGGTPPQGAFAPAGPLPPPQDELLAPPLEAIAPAVPAPEAPHLEAPAPASGGVTDFDVSSVPIVVEPIRLSLEDLQNMRKPGGILEYFGYNPSEPATEIDAWKRYALSIAAKCGDLLSGEIPGVRNSTSLEDGVHNISLDPNFFQKLESRILELARTTGKTPEQMLSETGITNPKEAWEAISSDVFRIRAVPPAPTVLPLPEAPENPVPAPRTETPPGGTTPPATSATPPPETPAPETTVPLPENPPAGATPRQETPVPPPIPRCSDGVLPQERSGNACYPKTHSVFTNTIQDHGSDGNWPPRDLDRFSYLDGVRDDYRRSDYGSTFLQQLAYEITQGGNNQSIERALIQAGKERFSIFTGQDPLYRLGEGSTIDKPQGDFEFLVIKGSPTGDRLFSFETEMIKRAVTDTYESKCKKFQVLDNPDKKELEAEIEARAKSAKANGRKLYILYTGHGTCGNYQDDLSGLDHNMQGSKLFKFGLDRISGFDENYYKKILHKFLKDVETISIFDACHSGSAVTATEPYYRRMEGIV